MKQTVIFGPFFAMMLLTLAVWIYMYARRIPFINASGFDPQELARPGRLAELSSPAVNNPSENFKNLFEMPVLFYALILYLFATREVDTVYFVAAWIFGLAQNLARAQTMFALANLYQLRHHLLAPGAECLL